LGTNRTPRRAERSRRSSNMTLPRNCEIKLSFMIDDRDCSSS
jgi:hypothetical protein